MFSPVSIRPFVCHQDYSETADQIFMKFYGMAGHNPRTIRLDLGGNPDQDPDQGILKRNFNTAVLATVKAPHRGFCNSLKIRRLADLKLKNKSKAALV